MDNLSHTVAGLAVGELIHRSLPDDPDPDQNRLRRRLLLVTCSLASNFPDLDLVLTPLLPAPLGYLLHHRGHTHTILYALPQAALLLALIWVSWSSARQLLKQNTVARQGMALALAIGFTLHLLMDYLNSYGIHPFHPIDSRWFYGDMVFIIEPVFWITFGIPMILSVQRRWLKSLYYAFLIGVPAFFTAKGFLPWPSLAVLIAMAGTLTWVQLKSGAKGLTGLILAAMIGVGFVGLQSYSSGLAKRGLKEILQSKDPESHFLDSAMSPFPANPVCWTFISIEKNEKENFYRLRRGLLSLAPNQVPVNSCPAALRENQQSKESTSEIAFFNEVKGDLKHLRELKEKNCHFDAWMRFARAPSVTETEAADLRFSSNGLRGNFTTLSFSDFVNRECSSLIPKWSYPRSDLLHALPQDGSQAPSK